MAAMTVMGGTCVGLVKEVDALGGDVRGPVEERHWYMVLERGPVEGRPGIKSPAGTIRTPQEVHRRRFSPNNTGDQGGRPTRTLRSSESVVTDEGKADERCERRFLWEGQSSSGSPVDKRPWQVDWTALPRHRFGGHWRWTRAVCIPGRNP